MDIYSDSYKLWRVEKHSPKDMLRARRHVYCHELVALGLDPFCELTTEVWARIEQARDRTEDERNSAEDRAN